MAPFAMFYLLNVQLRLPGKPKTRFPTHPIHRKSLHLAVPESRFAVPEMNLNNSNLSEALLMAEILNNHLGCMKPIETL